MSRWLRDVVPALMLTTWLGAGPTDAQERATVTVRQLYLSRTINRMGHDLPMTLGMRTEDLDKRIRKYFPDYMPMCVGMAEMMEMGRPKNTIGSSLEGPFGELDAGGAFTVSRSAAESPATKTPARTSTRRGLSRSRLHRERR